MSDHACRPVSDHAGHGRLPRRSYGSAAEQPLDEGVHGPAPRVALRVEEQRRGAQHGAPPRVDLRRGHRHQPPEQLGCVVRPALRRHGQGFGSCRVADRPVRICASGVGPDPKSGAPPPGTRGPKRRCHRPPSATATTCAAARVGGGGGGAAGAPSREIMGDSESQGAPLTCSGWSSTGTQPTDICARRTATRARVSSRPPSVAGVEHQATQALVRRSSRSWAHRVDERGACGRLVGRH